MNTETDERRYSKLLAQQIINRSPKIHNCTAAANQQCNKAKQHVNNYVVKTEIKEIKISLGIRFTIRITKNKRLRAQPTRTNCQGTILNCSQRLRLWFGKFRALEKIE